LSEEAVFLKLLSLCRDVLPEYIEEVNEQHNDGVILPLFTGVAAENGSRTPPYLKLEITGGEYTEKDRIIGNTVYAVELEFVLPKAIAKGVAYMRYREAVRNMLEEYRTADEWEECRMTGWKNSCVAVRAETA
jgi:hypothetical protein